MVEKNEYRLSFYRLSFIVLKYRFKYRLKYRSKLSLVDIDTVPC